MPDILEADTCGISLLSKILHNVCLLYFFSLIGLSFEQPDWRLGKIQVEKSLKKNAPRGDCLEHINTPNSTYNNHAAREHV